MPYCQPQDVRNLHQLFTATDFPDASVQVYIAKATTRMNNLIQPFYAVPLSDPVPDIVASIAADMAASLLCQTYFSGINYREDTPLAEVFRKRAEADLDHMLEHATIDGLPGVVKHQPDVPEMRKKVASSTSGQLSPVQKRMTQFNWATRSPLANVKNSVFGEPD